MVGAELTRFIFTTVPCPHFTDEAAEVQRGEVTCPGSRNWKVVEFLLLIRLLKQNTSPKGKFLFLTIIIIYLLSACLWKCDSELNRKRILPGLEEIYGDEWWMGLNGLFEEVTGKLLENRGQRRSLCINALGWVGLGLIRNDLVWEARRGNVTGIQAELTYCLYMDSIWGKYFWSQGSTSLCLPMSVHYVAWTCVLWFHGSSEMVVSKVSRPFI